MNTVTFAQLNKAHELMRLCEDEVLHHTGLKIRLSMYSAATEGRTPEQLLSVVARAVRMEYADFKTKLRKVNYVELRFLGVLFLKNYFPSLTDGDIAELFDMDRTSTIYNMTKATDLLELKDERFTSKYIIVKNHIEQWIKESTYESNTNQTEIRRD